MIVVSVVSVPLAEVLVMLIELVGTMGVMLRGECRIATIRGQLR